MPRPQNVEKPNPSEGIAAQWPVIRVLTVGSNKDIVQGGYLSPLHDDRCVVEGIIPVQLQLHEIAG